MAFHRAPSPPTTWDLPRPRRLRDGQGERVVVEIAGAPVTFRSRGAPLRASPEAFAGLFLLPALATQARLRVQAPLDPTWVLGTRTLTGIYADWWGYPVTYPIDARVTASDESPPAPAHALWFTGGVDAFHALLTASSRYDHLVFVRGFDAKRGDEIRLRAFEASLADIGKATSKRVLLLETDLREHPLFAAVSWERTHGAALAAVGHVLGRLVGAMTIPPTWSHARLGPWGSHPETDELWSTHRMRIFHGEGGTSYVDRVRRIAGYPLTWQHLRVCGEDLSEGVNCSRCEKCLRTMVSLDGVGALDRYEVFDRTHSLADRIDELPRIRPSAFPFWEELLDLDLQPDVRGAVERLARRSRPPWWRRAFGWRHRPT